MAVYGSERHGMPHQAMVFAKKELAADLDVRKVARAYQSREEEGVLGTDAAIWELEVHPTNFCNLKCAGCSYADRHDSSHIKVAGLVALLGYYSSFDLRSVFVSGGGDPAYWSGWEKVFRRVDCSRFKLGVSTNLSNWTQIGRVVDLLAFLQIHVVGFDSASVLSETGVDCFSAIERNLHRLSDAKGEGKQVTLKVLVTDRNYKELPRYLDFINKFPCDAVVLKLQQNFHRNAAEFAAGNIGLVRRIAQTHEIGDHFDLLVDNLDDEMYQVGDVSLDECPFPASGLYRLVRPDGLVYPCVASTYDRRNACGELQFEEAQVGPPLLPRLSQIDLASCPLRACRHYRCSLVLDAYFKRPNNMLAPASSQSNEYPLLL